MAAMSPLTTPGEASPGLVILFGSGETSASGSKIFQSLAPRLARPLRIAVLETPAGFELNSAQVAGRVAEFLRVRLQNDRPQVDVIPARKRGTAFSPDDPALAAPVRAASLVFMGAGSPTYAARQLRGSVVWQTVLAAHRLGTAVALASAATLAASTQTLPVYEIYKAGADPHWLAGLDFLAAYGLPLVIIPHWNNAEGGAELDTSHCFMGRERFADLVRQLPPDVPIVGLDEHTALVIDLARGVCDVMGTGGVTLVRQGATERWANRTTFPLAELGRYHLPAVPAGVAAGVWSAAQAERLAPAPAASLPPEVEALVAARQTARAAKDWKQADAVRARLQALGWQVKDTPQGPVVESL